MDIPYCPSAGAYRRALYAAAARCDLRGLLTLALARETAYEQAGAAPLTLSPLGGAHRAPEPAPQLAAAQAQRGA